MWTPVQGTVYIYLKDNFFRRKRSITFLCAVIH